MFSQNCFYTIKCRMFQPSTSSYNIFCPLWYFMLHSWICWHKEKSRRWLLDLKGVQVDFMLCIQYCCPEELNFFIPEIHSIYLTVDWHGVLIPERRTHSYQFEMLFNYYVRMLRKHHQQSQLGTVWGKVIQGLHLYSLSPELYSVFVEIGHLHTTPSKMRWILDDSCQK